MALQHRTEVTQLADLFYREVLKVFPDYFRINGWLKQQLIPILVFTAVFIAGYAVIWLIIYSFIKAKTEQLNKKLNATS